MIFELFKPKLLNINYFQRLCFEILMIKDFLATLIYLPVNLWKNTCGRETFLVTLHVNGLQL